MSTKEPVTLFYSYAHEDEKLRDELAKHLSLLKREGTIKEWHDRRIMPGDEWKHHIDHYLEYLLNDGIKVDRCLGQWKTPYQWRREIRFAHQAVSLK